MKQRVSIIMYHYVRDLGYSRYPEIKGLGIDQFKEQIAYIQYHYQVISAYDLMDAVESGTSLPSNALLLTFDDAYSDHFTYVFPVLDEEKLPGCFFPPAKCILEHQVLDVNKIHFILASVQEKTVLVDEIFRYLEENRHNYELNSSEYYWEKVAKPSRYDPAEVIFIKRMLQRELPEGLRKIITDRLFQKFVTNDEAAFSEELYMSLDQIACLQRNGMYVGSHGFDHYWLDTITAETQKREVDQSLQFLEMVGSRTDRWVMCYPHGSFNASLLKILNQNGCVLGLTTEVGIADLTHNDPLILPRLNTNDLPKEAEAAPNEWTRKGLSA
jgi:peptidoglycan/xylan/chitin deacetylase (PgdA/CDA1 family)